MNCASLGMAGTEGQFEDFSFLDGLRPGVPVVDLIHVPAETELLRQAHKRGHKTVNGFGLLVNQAVLSLERFTGAEIDAARMKKSALRTAVKKDGKNSKIPLTLRESCTIMIERLCRAYCAMMREIAQQ